MLKPEHVTVIPIGDSPMSVYFAHVVAWQRENPGKRVTMWVHREILKLRSGEGLMGKKAIEDGLNDAEIPADMEMLISDFYVKENAWHLVGAAIESLEKSEDLRALTLLKILRQILSKATGHEVEEKIPSGL